MEAGRGVAPTSDVLARGDLLHLDGERGRPVEELLLEEDSLALLDLSPHRRHPERALCAHLLHGRIVSVDQQPLWG
jgi:hypothetical protein